MGFAARITTDGIIVELSGWARLCCWRRAFEIPAEQIGTACVRQRGELEPSIQHREYGIGTHDGSKRPGRTRLGAMLGRGVRGSQLWAVSAGPAERELVVAELTDGRFRRAVIEVDDPTEATETLRGG